MSSGPIRAVAKFFFEGERKFFVKGVTYGPFKPDAAGHYLGPPDQADRDLAQMRELGINVVRVYHVPPLWFLDKCSQRRDARSHHTPLGEAYRIPAQESGTRCDR